MIILKIIKNGLSVSRIMRGGIVRWEPYTGGDNNTEMTPAILGIAILGRTILGSTASLPKLETPTIRLSSGVKLNTPVIYLNTVEGGSTDSQTPAILGVAILGRTILGSTTNLPKLEAPIICLSDDIRQKLNTPVIHLETISSETSKLETPVIRLEIVGDEGDDPVITQLDTPVIYLDTIEEPDEPDEPIVSKLSTPIIKLIVVDKPDEPDEPIIEHLETPIIHLEVVEDEDPEEPELPKLNTPEIYIDDQTHYHDYTSITTTPTCTERGYTTHTCNCGESYTDSYVSALGHDWSEPYYSGEFDTGYGRKCSRCNELEVIDAPIIKLDAPTIQLETMTEPEIPNEPEPVKLDTPTIRLIGLNAPVATLDGDVLSWNSQPDAAGYFVLSSGPSNNSVIFTLNGTKYGVIEITDKTSINLMDKCSQYNNYNAGEYTIYVLALSSADSGAVTSPLSKPVKWVYTKDQTEPDEPKELPKLSAPDIYLDEVHPHEYTSITTEPTCTEQGYTTHTCNCGKSYTDNYVNALGHDWGEPYFSEEDFVIEGYGRKCNRCGELEEMRFIVPLNAPVIYLKSGVADKLDVTLDGDILSWNAPDHPDVLYIVAYDGDGPLVNGKRVLSYYSDTDADLYQSFGNSRCPAGTYTIYVCYRVGKNDSNGAFSYWSDPVIYEYDGTALPKLPPPHIYPEYLV